MNPNQTIYLLAIHGHLAPKTLEAARSVHNETAGAPANVAAARSLGDLSHMVYIPLDHAEPQAGEFLILDQWNKLDGLNQFFADPHVQAGGDQIFSQREPLVWAPAGGFLSYHLPAPANRCERYIGVVRGRLSSIAQAEAVHNELVAGSLNQARRRGCLSHETYLRLAAPGTPEALEFYAVDTWMDLEGMGQQYEDPALAGVFEKMFAAQPSATTWKHPAGDWVEW